MGIWLKYFRLRTHVFEMLVYDIEMKMSCR